MPFLADLHPLDRAPDSAADRALDQRHKARKPKHTPGPWIAEEVGSTGGENPVPVVEVVTADGYERVCEYVSKDDARLIAAAPELLDALIDMLATAEHAYTVRASDGAEITHPAVTRARAAIAKATGRD